MASATRSNSRRQFSRACRNAATVTSAGPGGGAGAAPRPPGPPPGGRGLHGLEDLLVAGPPAEVPGEPLLDLGAGRVGVLLEQRVGGDELARNAEPALDRTLVEERGLDRRERAV